MGRVDPDSVCHALSLAHARKILRCCRHIRNGSLFLDTHYVLPRHPSQLYELALEGVVLFIILTLIRKPRPMGAVPDYSGLPWRAFRIIAEFFPPAGRAIYRRVGAHQHGADSLIPMIIAGAIMMVWAYRRRPQQHVSWRNHETVFRIRCKSAG